MLWLVLSALASVPWLGIRLVELVTSSHVLDHHADPYAVAVLTGLAILGSAYLLSVGAEVAQLDISRSLALAFLALVAILPEYAVDMVFAWKGGDDARFIPFATANMTGANRLLIGLFWPVVVFVFALKHRRNKVQLQRPFRLEVYFLLLATVYSFTLPFRRYLPLPGLLQGISLVDFVVLGGVFAWYAIRASKTHHDQVELEGPAQTIADTGKRRRRLIVLALFGWAALGIVAAAEPFATSLVTTGASLLSGLLGRQEAEFLMVQWVAPFASEAPELVVATIFALKALPEAALGSLISSKVNQWTLLIGALPAVYVLSHVVHGNGFTWAMPLDSRQAEEIFLTSAQSLLATVLLIDLSLSVRDAWLLLVLFLGQFFIPIEAVRWAFSGAYILLAIGFIVADPRRRAAAVAIVRDRGVHERPGVSRG